MIVQQILIFSLFKMSLCIIGAGMAGLCCARHALKNQIAFTVFEQTDTIGGTWVYTDEVGTNKFKLDIHSSMYTGLRTNLPKEIMGFPDFQIPHSKESYITSEAILKFLESYAIKFNLKEHIQFLSYVVRVYPKNDSWQLIVRNLKTNKIEVHNFDYVMICTGHYHTPMESVVQGSEIFNGKIMHSHDFKNSFIFKGHSVLIVGAGPSGIDLCNEISKVALKITLSHHYNTKYFQIKNVTEKPDVIKFDENGAFFADGSYDLFTFVLFCTGYKFSFPFLSMDCGVFVENNYVQPLFKHCININAPKLSFIGLPFYVCAAQMMDLQARFFLQFSGKMQLPSKKVMLLDNEIEMQSRWIQNYKIHQAHMMGTKQDVYYKDLANFGQLDPIKPVMSKLHNESSQRFIDDIKEFRNENFRLIDENNFMKI